MGTPPQIVEDVIMLCFATERARLAYVKAMDLAEGASQGHLSVIGTPLDAAGRYQVLRSQLDGAEQCFRDTVSGR